VIEAQALSVRPAGGPAIADVTFTVLPGEVLCLVGRPNGGQSTIVDTFAGRIRPYRGFASIAGLSCSDRPLDVRRVAAFVSPNQSWHLDLDARTNLAFFAELGGISTRHLGPRINNAMRMVGIADRLFSSRVASLSAGARCLLWLALAHMRECPAVLIQEPTMNVDEESWTLLAEAIYDLRTIGRAVMVTTFDEPFAQHAGTRVVAVQLGLSELCRPSDKALPIGTPIVRDL
jgi:ABC-type multidrug transport system ATPase subunit